MQEKFAQGVAGGLSYTQAAKKAGYSAKAAGMQGARLMKNARVAKRVAELKGKTEAQAEMSRAQAVAWLVRAIKTPVGALDAMDDLANSVKWLDGRGGSVLEVKGVCKIRAMERLAKMLGWDEPEKVQVGADDALTGLLASIRARREGGK